jgi:hypothetical protein
MLTIQKSNNKKFQKFVKRFQYWYEKFHMGSWDLVLEVSTTKDSDNYAQFFVNPSGMCGTVEMNPNIPEQQINTTALHEVIEILLIPLSIHARREIRNNEITDREVHIIVRTLEQVILDKVCQNEQ